MSSQAAIRHGPRPALHIPQGQPSDPFSDAFASGIMQDISITPGNAAAGSNIATNISPSPTNQSHFSPDTPRRDLEKGHGGLFPYPSLSKRIKQSIRIPRASASQNDSFNSGQQQKNRPKWILGGLLVILLLLLIGNIVYLDVRIISFSSDLSTPHGLVPSTSLQAAQKESAPSPESDASSRSLSPSTTASVSQRGLSDLTLNCISKFPPQGAAMNAPFCNECMSVLSTIPIDAFLLGTSQQDALTKVRVFCQNTVF